MSKNEIVLTKELLELLEKRYKSGEIDEESYKKLKERYEKRLEKALKDPSSKIDIKVSGSQMLTDKDLSIAGSSKISGGKILRDIRISGASKIDGDIECNSIKCAGAIKASGNITAHGFVKCSGSFKVDGFLHCDKGAKFSGSAKIGGNALLSGQLVGSGSILVEDNVQADEGVQLSGSIEVQGNILSKKDITLSGKAEILGNIVGENVYIKGRRGVMEIRLFKRRELSTIEGTIFAKKTVEIEDTYVNKDVKAVTVKLGPNTTVEGTVYYVHELLLADDVKLENEPVQIRIEELKL
ncbi:MAG: polymer-forming cytoskeletal protein [Candidatus Heimdallarchaeum aukensis]|uniref:Polymer-forming cytoskeletal protein n=1 Tax=Candidatus Heimdallarchaeum aukensis TaxID=2876573 RepID=A0A9Y1BJX7_9ARCH|nr:MAG: polymer-forming cytoskeletal protein [Candidatus Heimdallarchaeum aukensis]